MAKLTKPLSPIAPLNPAPQSLFGSMAQAIQTRRQAIQDTPEEKKQGIDRFTVPQLKRIAKQVGIGVANLPTTKQELISAIDNKNTFQ